MLRPNIAPEKKTVEIKPAKGRPMLTWVGTSATALAHPNIAIVKYWGNRDAALRLPANSSLSMNLAGLETRTTVTFDDGLRDDEVVIGGAAQAGTTRERVVRHLDHIRRLAGIETRARVDSENNFPSGAGLASSASAFAALTLAGCAAAGLSLSERELSALARLGSGSASRSIPGGFVEWRAADRHADSYAFSIAPPHHWALVDLVAIVSRAHKPTGSTDGHALADTSPLQPARVASAEARLDVCRKAILERDFGALAEVMEQDALAMHAVMMTSRPPLLYWLPPTLAVMQAVRQWRDDGLPIAFTIDAGPNVHCLCPRDAADEAARRLRTLAGVMEVLRAEPGAAARIADR